MESQSLKLSLNLSPPWLVGEQNNRDYIARLEHELRKIESFKRELPLSVLLLTDAIERLKEEVGRSDKEQAREAAAAACDLNESPRGGSEITVAVDGDKRTWMQSAQLWSSDQTLQLNSKRTRDVAEDKTGALSSFTEGSEISPAREDVDRNKPVVIGPPICLQVTTEPVAGVKIGGGDRSGCRSTFIPISTDEIKLLHQASISSELQGPKKQRRCWSPELHRRFIDALEKLGGSQVATPKQIRDLMQVNGLTNDEVKSHLQKYRLHIRKLPNSSASSSKLAKIFSSHESQPEGSGGGVGIGGTASKAETSQSASPQGPLHMAIRSVKCNSAASRCHSIEEDGEEKSDSHSCGGGF